MQKLQSELRLKIMLENLLITIQKRKSDLCLVLTLPLTTAKMRSHK
jgi:hypothetical protein